MIERFQAYKNLKEALDEKKQELEKEREAHRLEIRLAREDAFASIKKMSDAMDSQRLFFQEQLEKQRLDYKGQIAKRDIEWKATLDRLMIALGLPQIHNTVDVSTPMREEPAPMVPIRQYPAGIEAVLRAMREEENTEEELSNRKEDRIREGAREVVRKQVERES